MDGLLEAASDAPRDAIGKGNQMKLMLAALAAVLVLGACAPGTYTISYLERDGGGSSERSRDERPDDQQVGHPTIPMPPVVRPEPPVTPPVVPPAVPPAPEPVDPYEGCEVKVMPPKSANERIIKCPGQPAIVIKRP